MSIFGDIASAIFGTTEAKAAESAAAGAKLNADVIKILEQRDESSKEDLDWKESIVDLLKLLNLDSSLKARKALADELKYPGDKNDSAAMNMWLHKQVMTKLAENGGVVPKELQH